MNITFENGKKIITHPSGMANEYMIEQLEAIKAGLVSEKQEIENQITRVENDIAAAQATP